MLYVMDDGLSKIISSENPTGTAWLMIFGSAVAILGMLALITRPKF